MPKFEVAIFNQQVRDLIKVGDRHKDLGDKWADTHYIEVSASTSERAKKKMLERYPHRKGFVIVSVESAD